MLKKGLIAGLITVLIVTIVSYFSGESSYIYNISGILGLLCVALSLGYFIDSLILGSKGTFFSEKQTRKTGRLEDSIRFISIAVPNLIAAFIYWIN